MTYYYYELDSARCTKPIISSDADQSVVSSLLKKHGSDLLIVYKESDTLDGTPFIELYEKSADIVNIVEEI